MARDEENRCKSEVAGESVCIGNALDSSTLLPTPAFFVFSSSNSTLYTVISPPSLPIQHLHDPSSIGSRSISKDVTDAPSNGENWKIHTSSNESQVDVESTFHILQYPSLDPVRSIALSPLQQLSQIMRLWAPFKIITHSYPFILLSPSSRWWRHKERSLPALTSSRSSGEKRRQITVLSWHANDDTRVWFVVSQMKILAVSAFLALHAVAKYLLSPLYTERPSYRVLLTFLVISNGMDGTRGDKMEIGNAMFPCWNPYLLRTIFWKNEIQHWPILKE